MASEGTASVLAVKPALAELEERGLNAEAVLHSAGLSRAALDSVENRVPYESLCRFWQASAAAAGDSCFGVHVAVKLPAGAYEVVDYVMAVAATAGEGLTRLTEYVRLIYDRTNFRLVLEPGFARVVRRTAFSAPQYDEFTLALLLTRSRQASGVDWTPERLSFAHERREACEEVSRTVRCPVQYGQGEMELRFSGQVLALPHQRADCRLLSVLTRYANSLLAALPGQGDLVSRVSSAIAGELSRGLPTLLTTAASLRLTPRTLQRQLAHTGASHSALLDEVRRALAMKYIGDAALSVGEIGYLLHFSDATAFHRAFKRWTGEAPVHYRQRLFAT